MQPNKEPSASEKITALNSQLLQAYIQKDNAHAQLDTAEKQIQAIRNLLAGIPVGQALQTDILRESEPTKTPVPA